ATPATGKGLTQEGMSIGTPDYMSPEQLSGQELDARSDLYAAGVVLFECLTARLPFEAASVYALIAKHIEQPAPDPRTLNPEIPEGLAKVIMKAMAKEPGDRDQSAAQMRDPLAARRAPAGAGCRSCRRRESSAGAARSRDPSHLSNPRRTRRS